MHPEDRHKLISRRATEVLSLYPRRAAGRAKRRCVVQFGSQPGSQGKRSPPVRPRRTLTACRPHPARVIVGLASLGIQRSLQARYQPAYLLAIVHRSFGIRAIQTSKLTVFTRDVSNSANVPYAISTNCWYAPRYLACPSVIWAAMKIPSNLICEANSYVSFLRKDRLEQLIRPTEVLGFFQMIQSQVTTTA